MHYPDPYLEARCNEISNVVIGAAIEVHRHVGPGLLVSAYESCLCRELSLRSVCFERQLILPLEYKGEQIDFGYKIDVMVENLVVVELKAVEKIRDVHEAQVLTYLRLSERYLDLLLNFNETRMKDGIKRIINPAAGHNTNLLNL